MGYGVLDLGVDRPCRSGCQGRRLVIFAYPRAGRPGIDPPTGWDSIPGARGCTPEACAFRDLSTQFTALGAEVYGLSTQDTEYQQEAVSRLHLPYPLLSDAGLRLAVALRLPTFSVEGMSLLRRPADDVLYFLSQEAEDAPVSGK